MVYGSYATGYRAGGFNARGNNEPTVGPYDPEEVGSWELGIRTQPTDRLQLNLTGFVSDYTDKQQFIVTDGSQCGQSNTATCTFIRNAAETTNQGIEVEGVWMPTDRLTIRGTYGYLDAEFDSYDFDGTDISDRAQVIYAPENTFSLMADHTSSIFGGTFIVSGTFSYRSDVWGAAAYETYNYETGPDINIDSHDQLDLSATWIRDLAQGQLKLMVYGTDVLEGDGRVARAYDAGAFSWSELVPGRQIGVTVGYEF
jgi:iron complex outermembrane receptor protein